MNNVDHVQDKEMQNDEVRVEQSAFKTRTSETILAVAFLAVIWLLPFISASEAGGLGGVVMAWFGVISAVFGALLLFFPLQLLIRHSLDEKKKTIPRIILLSIFGVIIAYSIPNLTPAYIQDMKFAAHEYYSSNPQKFTDATEGKTIEINVLSGPYITYFVYTELDKPERQKGGTVIDFNNGWYFVGVFYPI